MMMPPQPPRRQNQEDPRVSALTSDEPDEANPDLARLGETQPPPRGWLGWKGSRVRAPTLGEPDEANPELKQLRARVKSLTDEVKSLTDEVKSLTGEIAQLRAADSGQAFKHAGEQERRLRETEDQTRELREAIRSLAESVERVQSSECSAEERSRALSRAQEMIKKTRSYWSVEGPPEIDDRLAAVEQVLERVLNEMSARPDRSADGTSDAIAAVARIGTATLVGACVGAPIGAIAVGDAVVKEMVKAAIAVFVAQTAMELIEFGIDRFRDDPHSPD